MIIHVLLRVSCAQSIIEEDRIAFRDSKLNEVVIRRFVGTVPVGPGLSNAMSGKKDNLLLAVGVLWSTERGGDLSSKCFRLRPGSDARKVGTGSRCRDCEEVLQSIIVVPFREVEDDILGFECHRNGELGTIGSWWIV